MREPRTRAGLRRGAGPDTRGAPARRSARADQSKTNGPGDCGAVAVQVMVMKPNAVTFRVPPKASRVSPEATVPVRGPTSRASPVDMAGFLVPLKTTVPPPSFTIFSSDARESLPMASGAVTAEVLMVTVAHVPFCVAVRVASPPPQVPQSALTVADPEATVAAAAAKARPQITRVPAARDRPRPAGLPRMGYRLPFRVGGARWGDSGGGTVRGTDRLTGSGPAAHRTGLTWHQVGPVPLMRERQRATRLKSGLFTAGNSRRVSPPEPSPARSRRDRPAAPEWRARPGPVPPRGPRPSPHRPRSPRPPPPGTSPRTPPPSPPPSAGRSGGGSPGPRCPRRTCGRSRRARRRPRAGRCGSAWNGPG